ncbi:MAG: DNA-binding response regulator [Acidobacteria bacterium SCN 69-37]|nr:MAG: DNA-binding response regulator [Acidobacteria bacterium SCN 69-37]
MRLLVVEDEPDLRRSLVRSLADAQFAVDESADGEDALFRALEVDYDAIVLDLMLPIRSGESVLEAIRRAGRTTPVLLLTARDTIADRVRGLNHGADDYLTKPFVIDELVARLRALIRRAQQQPSPIVAIGDLRIDLVRRRVYRDDIEVPLTGREFGILEQLVRHRGRILTRTMLSEHLYNDASEVMSNAIDVHIAAIRRKLGPTLIETRRGQGYLIDA